MPRAFLFGLLAFLLCVLSANGQTPVIQWQKTFGSFNGDYPQSIRSTADGGFIVAGYTEGADGDVEGYHGNLYVGDIWLTKLSASGQLQWSKCLGGFSVETGADIRQTSDGGYIVAGSSASTGCGFPAGHGGLDYWLVKLSPTGDIQWQTMLGGSGNEYANSLTPTTDGGYIIGGYTSSSDGQVTGFHPGGAYSFDWWVVKVDGSGNLLWEKTFGGSRDDQCWAVQGTADGGCIAAGYLSSTDGDGSGSHGGDDDLMVKLDAAGNVQWKKLYGGSGSEAARAVLTTPDGGYIFGGSTTSNDGDVSGNHWGIGPGDQDFWVVKTDANGNIQWQKCYGGSLNEAADCMQPASDGGWVLAGTAGSHDGDLSCDAGVYDAWVIKIDATGNLQWSKSLGGSSYDEGFAVQLLADGSAVVAIATCSVEVPGYHLHNTSNGTCDDYWIVMLSPPQAIPPSPVVTISPASGTVCSGSPATFTASIQNSGVSPSYQWTRNGSPVGTNAPTYVSSGLANSDVIAVTVQSGTGICDVSNGSASASVTVHTNPNILHPTIKISSGTSYLCACGAVTFAVAVTGGGTEPAYQWMINGVIQGISSESFLSNSLQPTDLVSCQYYDSSGCVANAPVLSNSISLAPGGSGPALVSITGPTAGACVGSPETFTANPLNGGTNPVYQWEVNGGNVGSNTSVFTSSGLNNGDVVVCILTPDPTNACVTGGAANSNPVTVELTAKSNPSVAVTASSDLICKGNEVDFTATAQSAGANPSYAWEVNGVPDGALGPDFSGQGFANGDIVQCVVTVDPNFGCALASIATSVPVALQVIDQPNPTISIAASPNEACAGSIVKFSAEALNGGTTPSYQWSVNGAPVGGNGTDFGSTQLNNGDVVICKLTPGSGACAQSVVQSNAVVADVQPLPVVEVFPADTVVLLGSRVTLRAELSGDVVSYQWKPANLLTDPMAVMPETMALQDSVSFTLTATTAAGCTSTGAGKILVYRALVLPNAFTPNGDGANDVFRVPPGVTMQLSEFTIYDRWGMRVFTTRNAGEGWDGLVGGRPAPAGVYVYLIVGSDLKGPVSAKGTLILVR